MVAGGGILKVLHDDKIILKEKKKKMRGHYYLTESPMRGGASGARRISEQGGAPMEVDRALDGRLGRTRDDIVE